MEVKEPVDIRDLGLRIARGIALGLEPMAEAFRNVTFALTDWMGYQEKERRGHLCGNRDMIGTAYFDSSQEWLDARVAHRRTWRRCKRYWTQTKAERLPRGERY